MVGSNMSTSDQENSVLANQNDCELVNTSMFPHFTYHVVTYGRNTNQN